MRLKRPFLRGLAALLPTLLTLVILLKCYELIDVYISGPLNRGAIRLIIATPIEIPALTNEEVRDYLLNSQPGLNASSAEFTEKLSDPDVIRSARMEKLQGIWNQYYLNVLGFIAAVVLVCLVGLFLASFVGRRFWRSIEDALVRVPVIKQVYSSVKQITDFLFSDTHPKWRRVVAVEYPRKGLWSMGLVTGEAWRAVQTRTGKQLVSVFIPSSPTPITGYVIAVCEADIIDLPITIDEALRYSVSGGVIMPLSQQMKKEVNGGINDNGTSPGGNGGSPELCPREVKQTGQVL